MKIKRNSNEVAWCWYIDQQEEKEEPALQLGFETKINEKGETVHFKSKRGVQVFNPRKTIHWPNDYYVPVPEKEPKWKFPEKLTLIQKLLLLLGILTIKKQNEK